MDYLWYNTYTGTISDTKKPLEIAITFDKTKVGNPVIIRNNDRMNVLKFNVKIGKKYKITDIYVDNNNKIAYIDVKIGKI